MTSRRPSSGRASGSQRSRSRDPLPAIAACFLVRFDKRVGYSIAWSRSIEGLELDGVEFKTLPSGLHNVPQDIIYFTHNEYSGLAAYRQRPSDEEDRNASFLALGILVTRTDDSLGESWLHAETLQDLSERMLESPDDLELLETYWEDNKISTTRQRRSTPRRRSSGIRSQFKIAATDPRRSLLSLLDTFGPLLFPLWRAALLRERVLLVGDPPLGPLGEMVYNLGLLSTLPRRAYQAAPEPRPIRTATLFTIGIHDIPTLEEDSKQAIRGDLVRPSARTDEGTQSAGWVACSSDKLLSTKNTLSDIRVNIESNSTKTPEDFRRPEVYRANDTRVQATQRDLRRFKAFRHSLSKLEHRDYNDQDEPSDGDGDHTNLLPEMHQTLSHVDIPDEDSIVEPQSWAAMVYDGYMWWASAGEQAINVQEEAYADGELRFETDVIRVDDEPLEGSLHTSHSHSPAYMPAIILSYFQTWSHQILRTLRRVVEDAATDEEKVTVTKEDIMDMGLDPWSPNDRIWVARMTKLYYRREAEVEGGSVECCGVRLY